MYDFEPERLENFLKKEEIRKVAVQLPSGLRPYTDEIRAPFEEEGLEVIFLADSCYGACDITDREAVELGCDALVHYGHADMGVPTSLPTFYMEARVETDISEVLKKALSELEGLSWGLTATVQHVGFLEEAQEVLDEKGIKSVIGESGPRSKYPGQVLGCDWGSAKAVSESVDGFLYIGTGSFHPLVMVLATEKPVISVNPISEGFEILEPNLEDFLKKRYALLTKAKSSKRFGVIASTKQGQNRLSLAESLAESLERKGYESHILVGGEISPDTLKNYQLDAFVNTACPRIPIDDAELYDSPILTPFEAKVLLGEEEWEPYRLDEIGINFEE